MTIECPMCLRPLPETPAHEPVTPRTADEALLLSLITRGDDTAWAVTRALTGITPSRAHVERVRRRLEAAVRAGLLTRVDGRAGGAGGTEPTRYRLAAG